MPTVHSEFQAPSRCAGEASIARHSVTAGAPSRHGQSSLKNVE
jgi:hypothetical protein